MLNFGDMLEAIEEAIDPEHPAFLHGDTVVGWGAAARLSNTLARNLLAHGAAPGARIAIYLRNCPEYLITMGAAFKARLVPVNVNYRYASDELIYLLDNADAAIVVYGAEFRDRIEHIRDRLPGVARWVEVGETDTPPFAEAMADLTGSGDCAPVAVPRSPDDVLFIYTGGTTGMPTCSRVSRKSTLMHARWSINSACATLCVLTRAWRVRGGTKTARNGT